MDTYTFYLKKKDYSYKIYLYICTIMYKYDYKCYNSEFHEYY